MVRAGSRRFGRVEPPDTMVRAGLRWLCAMVRGGSVELNYLELMSKFTTSLVYCPVLYMVRAGSRRFSRVEPPRTPVGSVKHPQTHGAKVGSRRCGMVEPPQTHVKQIA